MSLVTRLVPMTCEVIGGFEAPVAPAAQGPISGLVRLCFVWMRRLDVLVGVLRLPERFDAVPAEKSHRFSTSPLYLEMG